VSPPGDAAPAPALPDVLALALVEARRYGDDDRIWIRELVQNARDAGARHITFRRESDDVIVDDDGSGMSRQVVIGQLLRLFSSSKGDDRGAAGCFGVGFWSVLRARPARIEVDAVDARGNGVGVVIDVGRGTIAERPARRRGQGTSIRLVSTTPAASTAALRAGILDHAAMVRGRAATPPIVALDADGRVEVLNRPFDLGDLPGVVAGVPIGGDGFAGHVGLSPSPRVELFHHGLRVVEATDLAAIVPSLRQRPRRGLGLVLRVDMPGLKVLVDRRTVVEDDAVRRLVASCEAAAARLERQVLDDAAPLPAGLRLLDAVGRAVARPMVRVAAVAVAASAIGLGGGLLITGPGPLAGLRGAWATAPTTEAPRSLGVARAGLGPPRIDVVGSAAHGYQIATRGVLDDLLAIELRDVPDEVEALRPRAAVDSATTPSPTPNAPIVATAQLVGSGRTILPRSQILWPVRAAVGGTALPIGLGLDELPVVELPAGGAIVDGFYALSPPPPPGPTTTPSLAPSAGLAAIVAAGGGDHSLRGVQQIGEAVSAAIRWAADADAARRFDADPRGVIDKALALGVGDCDVMNAVYVRALQAAGFRARLARGLVIRRDAVATDLHAWGEVWVDGGWHLVDASPRAAIPVPVPQGAGLPGLPTAVATTAPTTTTTTVAANAAPTTGAAGTAAAPPATTAIDDAASSAGARAIAAGLAVGLGVGLGSGVWWWRARRRRTTTRRDVDDVIPLLVAGLQSGAAASLGLLDRAVLPTSHGTISLRRARALAARGRLALSSSSSSSPWLHRSVHVLPRGAPRVTALLPFLPRVVDVDALTSLLADDDTDDGRRRVWQARIDRVLAGVALRPMRGPGVREVHLRSRDGQTHQVLVGDDVFALPPDEGWRRLLETATCLWQLGARP